MRRAIALPLALFAVLSLGATVLAGGWASVDGSGPTEGVVAGSETTVELDVLQHGVTPVSWPRITVIATNSATGETFTTTATPTAGQTGHYTATLTFPSEGSWTLTYDSPDLVMVGTATLAVGAPVVAAATASTVAADLMIALAVSAAILILLAMLAAFNRSKQPAAVRG